MSDLAARLYAALAAEPGNLAISPHSVAVALGLAAYGARGRTRDEIRAVVGDAGRPVEGGSEVELASANRLFGQQGLTWQTDLADAAHRGRLRRPRGGPRGHQRLDVGADP